MWSGKGKKGQGDLLFSEGGRRQKSRRPLAGMVMPLLAFIGAAGVTAWFVYPEVPEDPAIQAGPSVASDGSLIMPLEIPPAEQEAPAGSAVQG